MGSEVIKDENPPERGPAPGVDMVWPLDSNWEDAVRDVNLPERG